MTRWVPWVAPLLGVSARLAHAKLLMTQEEALAKAFPGAVSIERKTLFLTSAQMKRIETLAGAKVESQIFTYYEGKNATGSLGKAFFDTRVVRTMPMTFMALIQPDGSLGFVEILAFHEPEDYLPRFSWLKLYKNRRLTDAFRLRRDIPNVTGASLTCQTIQDGVRTLLAVHQMEIS